MIDIVGFMQRDRQCFTINLNLYYSPPDSSSPSIHQAKQRSDEAVVENAQPNHKPTLLETDDLPDLLHNHNPEVNLFALLFALIYRFNVQP